MRDFRVIKLDRLLRDYFSKLLCNPHVIDENFFWYYREKHSLATIIIIDNYSNIHKLFFEYISFKFDLEKEDIDLVCSIINDVFCLDGYNIDNIMLR